MQVLPYRREFSDQQVCNQALSFRPPESFADAGTNEAIVKIRHQHYDEKRKGKIKLIADSIKTGMLEDMKETFISPQELKSIIDGKERPKKRQSNYVGPDVPLASPLDPEHARVHREAFEYEKNKKVEAIQQRLAQMRLMDATKKQNQETEALKLEKKIEKNLKEQATLEKMRLANYNQKILGKGGKLEKYKKEERQHEWDKLEKIKELRATEERDRLEQKKHEEVKYENQFKKDMENYQRHRDKSNSAANKQMADEQMLVSKLESFEEKMERQKRLREEMVQQRAHEMHFKLEQEQEMLEKMKLKHEQEMKDPNNKNKSSHGDWEQHLIKRRERQRQSEAAIKLQQEICEGLVLKHKEKMHGAKIARKNLNEKFKDNANKIIEIEKEKEQQSKFIKDQFQEELEKRKEIMSLRKMDQEENYQRGKNFHSLYKNKLIEQIMEKSAKADAIKQAQERIAKACLTNRNMAFAVQDEKKKTTRQVKDEGKKVMAQTH